MNTLMSPELDKIKEIMDGFIAPWYIAGGWSIDLFLGRKTREHKDMDLVIFRQYKEEVIEHFHGWDIQMVVFGEDRFEQVSRGMNIEKPNYCLHLRKGDEFVEILFTDVAEGSVIYRRDESVRMSLDDFVHQDRAGRKFVTPEWQLLFKSKSPRLTDEEDFKNIIYSLSIKQLNWLKIALEHTNQNEEWKDQLSKLEEGRFIR
ncbi:nucleotidyltransferase domain-containing protein [Paenibacillus turpanensis]|uniref:nucleotidyltransferase domain-containing protein n=1 Tax=Paenibacillus turpanensis TaxID=2689078 RepID=UPI0014072489|nr:hypothetical protein [Paenibacillus turpanensis]